MPDQIEFKFNLELESQPRPGKLREPNRENRPDNLLDETDDAHDIIKDEYFLTMWPNDKDKELMTW